MFERNLMSVHVFIYSSVSHDLEISGTEGKPAPQDQPRGVRRGPFERRSGSRGALEWVRRGSFLEAGSHQRLSAGEARRQAYILRRALRLHVENGLGEREERQGELGRLATLRSPGADELDIHLSLTFPG